MVKLLRVIGFISWSNIWGQCTPDHQQPFHFILQPLNVPPASPGTWSLTWSTPEERWIRSSASPCTAPGTHPGRHPAVWQRWPLLHSRPVNTHRLQERHVLRQTVTFPVHFMLYLHLSKPQHLSFYSELMGPLRRPAIRTWKLWLNTLLWTSDENMRGNRHE